jgi:3-oxoadipate enol-lactonase
MFASTGEIVTHYCEEGLKDRPSVALINSLGTDLRIWDPISSRLSSRYHVIRYDKRGHGLSDCPEGPYRLSDFADDLDLLRQHLQIVSMVLVGISIGGQIAMEYALRYPQSVSALILCNTAARVGSEELWSDRIDFVRRVGMAGAAAEIIPIWFTDSYHSDFPAQHRGYLNMLARTPTEGYAASCAALRDGDLTERVGNIQAKSLVLAGREDKATPPEQGRALAEALPNARFEMVEGAGHLSCIEQPDLLAQKIEVFLEELDNA